MSVSDYTIGARRRAPYSASAPSDVASDQAENALSDILVGTVADLVIPRLGQTYQASSTAPETRLKHNADIAATHLSHPALAPETIAAFVRHLGDADPQAALASAESLMADKHAFERVCFSLLTPAARHLGDLWIGDELSFVDVTLAFGRIRSIFHRVRQISAPQPAMSHPSGIILLAPTPGEQHSFGLQIVDEMLTRAGFETELLLPKRLEEIVSAVARQSYDVVGFSISGDRLIDPLRSIITLVRQHALNRSVRVIIGGASITDHPHLVDQVGADAAIDDARYAVSVIRSVTKTQASSAMKKWDVAL